MLPEIEKVFSSFIYINPRVAAEYIEKLPWREKLLNPFILFKSVLIKARLKLTYTGATVTPANAYTLFVILLFN